MRSQSAPPVRTSRDDAGSQFRAAANALQFVKHMQGKPVSSGDGSAINCLSFRETGGYLPISLPSVLIEEVFHHFNLYLDQYLNA